MPRPNHLPLTSYSADPLSPLHETDGWLWAPLKRTWLAATPEEYVRQKLIHLLHTRYEFALEQMDQECRTMHGRNSPRADVVVARSPDALRENRDYVLVAECKRDNLPISATDYSQGESYARAVQSEFLIMSNARELRCFRIIPGAPGRRDELETVPSLSDLADERKLLAIRRATKAFSRDEFRKVLSDCHKILRDNHNLEPGAAFDEISKILFVKMWVERTGENDRFTADYLRQYMRLRRRQADQVAQDLFEETKEYYTADQLFPASDTLNVSYETFLRIVGLLERFNLSATGEDVKGIAFEKFLGETFRGQLGQFFTPRPVVDFMVEVASPNEGTTICDPASGSGGFLIKCFEHVREDIENDLRLQKEEASRSLEDQADREGWTDEEFKQRRDEAFALINLHLDVQHEEGRLAQVARSNIFGADAEARAARTSKMNMIMHGDGHCGIYWHDGLVDYGGIFEDRFDLVITNPPFGSSVGEDQIIGGTEKARISTARDEIDYFGRRFGEPWQLAHARNTARANARAPVLSTFDVGRDPVGPDGPGVRIRPTRPSEVVFIERCIRLLRKGGLLAIVLPESILNNPSYAWLREWVEDHAKLIAVVSLPDEVFRSSDATVKTSVVLLRRFDEADEQEWSNCLTTAGEEVASELAPSIEEVEQALEALSGISDTRERANARSDLQRRLKELHEQQRQMTRERAKAAFDYPVFMAVASTAGITSTGETGDRIPNDLPRIALALKDFLQESVAEENAECA